MQQLAFEKLLLLMLLKICPTVFQKTRYGNTDLFYYTRFFPYFPCLHT